MEFSGIQYSLQCSIVEPGNEKDVYHISNDTTHNPLTVCFYYATYTFQSGQLASLAKWLGVSLRTKWLWVRVLLQSPITPFLLSQSLGIFLKNRINHGIVMIKSDNTPTQYKNNWGFSSTQHLTDKYNVTILRVYGAAGHGKGLTDAMSSFRVKNILRQSINTNDWFRHL